LEETEMEARKQIDGCPQQTETDLQDDDLTEKYEP